MKGSTTPGIISQIKDAYLMVCRHCWNVAKCKFRNGKLKSSLIRQSFFLNWISSTQTKQQHNKSF